MNKNTLKVVFVLTLILGVLLGLKLLPRGQEKLALKVSSVIPKDQSVDVQTMTKIQIFFNQPLDETSKIKFEIKPEILFQQNLKNEGLFWEIIPNFPLKPETEYGLVIKNNQEQILWQSKFQTEKLQGDPSIPFESQKYQQNNFPLIKFIPYETENFSVVYSAPLTLKVTIKKGSQETILKTLNLWMEKNNVDPKTHQVVWENLP